MIDKDLKKARQLVRTLGMRAAAGYLRNCGYSIGFTVYHLRPAQGR